MTERRTAQEHLDYWLHVMATDPETDSGYTSAQLHAEAKREVRYWRRQVRMEYRASLKARSRE